MRSRTEGAAARSWGPTVAAIGSVLDVDRDPRRVLEDDQPHAVVGGEPEVPGGLRFEVAALDEVDERGQPGMELGRAVVARVARLGLLGATAHRQRQEALASDLDLEPGSVGEERRRGLG